MAILASREAIREKLIRLFTTNYVSLLSRKTNLSRGTITKFFNEEKIRPDNMEKIYDAALELIRSRKEAQRKRDKLVHELGLSRKRSTK